MRFSFSSEEPVSRWYGDEILSHEPGAVRLGRANSGACPLLFNHNMDDLIGKVEGITIESDRRGYADIRFGRDARGDWALAQASDDILVNVSFMYRVHKFIEDTENETYTAIDWEPYEVSLVTVPADASVGIGRSDASDEMSVVIETRSQLNPATADIQEESEMFKNRKFSLQEQATDGTAGGASAGVVVDAPKERALGAEAERSRIASIEGMCKAHNIGEELRRGLIQKGATVDEARAAVLDAVLARGATPAVNMGADHNPDLTDREKAKYSMIRAINAAVNNDWKAAGFELEVSNDIAKRSGRSPSNGFFAPTNIPFAMRAPYAAGATATGGAVVATNLLAGSFIELLRAKARVMQLGATLISGLVGNVDIPRQTGASAAFWVTEGSTLPESEGTFDKVSLALKSVGTYSQISRNMLLQSTPDIEMLVRADLLATIALGVDLAALSGTGASGQPLGIVNTSGIGSVPGGTNGAAITIDHLIDLETQVAVANADDGALAYLANAKTVGALKKLKSTTGEYLWSNTPGGQRTGTPGEINGYPVARSNQARSNLTKGTASGICSEIVFGNWAEVMVGEWGVLEILPNPYESAAYKAGAVLIRAMQSLDVAIRHAASFSVMSDALT